MMIDRFHAARICAAFFFSLLTSFVTAAEGERLVVPTPAGLEMISHSAGKAIVFVAPGESLANWTVRLSGRVATGARSDRMDVYLDQLVASWRKDCATGNTGRLTADNEKRTAVVYGVFDCTDPKGQAQTVVFKSIIGGLNYDILYMFAEKPKKTAVSAALTYLKKVSVCEPEMSSCPEGM